MTRIIAGAAGGRRIQTPRGDRTRPTSDRVREALFASLDAELGPEGWDDVTVLDLYAGTGALGLEAASRGARTVVCVESHGPTAALIRRNAADVGLAVEVKAAPVRHALGGPPPHAFDLVLSDPPYDVASEAVADDLSALVRGGWLAPDAIVVVERDRRSPAIQWPDGLADGRVRRYGETVLYVGYADNEQSGHTDHHPKPAGSTDV